MLSTIWSEKIQGILMLERSRDSRFQEDKKDIILNSLRIKNSKIIVDMGCGPGTLIFKLENWLNKDRKFIGIDRDENFIDFAKNKNTKKSIEFIRSDILKTPLKNSSVDAAISNTVIEHVPNEEFLLEQKRIDCRIKN
ncbi:MAG: class I SAM-dependent methyltransferase [Miniphocaeibacter sp.]|uniref:class I SAM-dependent methyltransferase n=1 Tax=Miniphocaeibacter sp. TaxID=3100973 RepID=UPI0017B20F8D|nr:class I SAM-dependent methyltransferase [Gallicola sp.]